MIHKKQKTPSDLSAPLFLALACSLAAGAKLCVVLVLASRVKEGHCDAGITASMIPMQLDVSSAPGARAFVPCRATEGAAWNTLDVLPGDAYEIPVWLTHDPLSY